MKNIFQFLLLFICSLEICKGQIKTIESRYYVHHIYKEFYLEIKGYDSLAQSTYIELEPFYDIYGNPIVRLINPSSFLVIKLWNKKQQKYEKFGIDSTSHGYRKGITNSDSCIVTNFNKGRLTYWDPWQSGNIFLNKSIIKSFKRHRQLITAPYNSFKGKWCKVKILSQYFLLGKGKSPQHKNPTLLQIRTMTYLIERVHLFVAIYVQ